MAQGDQLQTLLELPLLQGLAEDTKYAVAGVFQSVSEHTTHESDETLLREGGLGGDTGFVLLSGDVTIEKSGEALATVSAPALIGEMQQLNPRAQRSATVRTCGAAQVLRFSWREFYAQAKSVLTPEEQTALMNRIEEIVLERFTDADLVALPMLEGLDEPLKVRICLVLQWISTPITLAKGEVLFKQDDMCGDTGYLLEEGALELSLSGKKLAVTAPDVIGMMPHFVPDARWTATAKATQPLQLKKFSWLNFLTTLEQRVTEDTFKTFKVCIKDYVSQHFAH